MRQQTNTNIMSIVSKGKREVPAVGLLQLDPASLICRMIVTHTHGLVGSWGYAEDHTDK